MFLKFLSLIKPKLFFSVISMAEQNSNIESFKRGFDLFYRVSYLGKGPVEKEIPDHIIERRIAIPGELVFSLGEVRFRADNEDDMRDKNEIRFSMDQLQGETACQKNKIIFITLLKRDGNEEERRYYFDVSEDGERSRAVYHPQWIKFAKLYNEQQKQ